jgi:ATP-dependent RNA helicase RhlE
MSFDSFGLRPELLRALAERGYTTPTPVQTKSIPGVLAGRDMLAGAQTGTGKTAAFTLPILDRLSRTGTSRKPRALVLVPTRELAAQVAESVRHYGVHLPVRCAVIFGGVGIQPQIDALRRGTDIVVATPGRLLDHAGQGTVDLGAIEILVLDEADRMLDMGFIHDIKRVLKLLPHARQNLLFSATYSDEIRQLAQRLLRDPLEVEVARRNTAVESVEQRAFRVDKGDKRSLLSHLIRAGSWAQVLVFTRTKHGANRLTKQLESDGIRAAAIHGNKSQTARTRALADFKSGSITALVATEVAARGLDIKELPYVVNYELPNVPEDYVHRIGRTGRAGASGQAVSLVADDEIGLLRGIERVIGRRIETERLPDVVTPPPTMSIVVDASSRSEPDSRHRSTTDHRGGPGRAARPRGDNPSPHATTRRGGRYRQRRPASGSGR